MLRNDENKTVHNSQQIHVSDSENIAQNQCKDTKNISNSNTNCIACEAKELLLAEKGERIDDLKKQIKDLEKHVESSEKHINDLNKHIDTLLVEIKKPPEEITETVNPVKGSGFCGASNHPKGIVKNRL